jgi:glycosidase
MASVIIGGIIFRLIILHDLGVNLLWIGPIFASPMDDNGYDVSDYYSINPKYGTMADLDRLLKEAHLRGIRILLDFPLNHTSDEHPWFQSALKDVELRNMAIISFKKARSGTASSSRRPTGRVSSPPRLGKQIPGSDDFYLHIFSKKMPDVNWANPLLRERILQDRPFYLDKGVDGFRLDAVAHLAKDLSFSDSTGKPDLDGCVYDTSKFSNRPELFDYLQLLKENVFSHYDCCTVGEAGGCISPKTPSRWPTGKTARSRWSSISIRFGTMATMVRSARSDEDIVTDVLSLKSNFMHWYNVCHDKADMPLYWCNHDHPRVVSQYGSVAYRNESAKMLLTTLAFPLWHALPL